MRRMVVTGAVVAFLLCISGCGGGADLGMPTDSAAPKKVDMSDKFDKMKGMVTRGKTSTPPAPSK